MKGFLLSAFIIISFIAYVFAQKFGLINLPFFSEEAKFDDARTSTPITIPVTPTNTPSFKQISNKYQDGSYTGDSIDANYGNIQVKATITNGKITDVQFLDYPKDRTTSQKINNKAMPVLISEAITVQNANVDTVTGATFTSEAFVKSLQSALNKAV